MKIAFFSRNRSFAGPLIGELQRNHTVKIWQHNNVEAVNWASIKYLLDWCDVAYLEWLQQPTIEISQIQGLQRPLIAFCQGIDVLNHSMVNWNNISGLIIQDANYPRLLSLRKSWPALNQDKPPLPRLPKILIQSIGVDLGAFTLLEDPVPGYHIVTHASQIRPVKRIYEAIQCFYELTQRSKKPWRMTLIGHWESPWRPMERMEYLQAVRELIDILNFPPERLFTIPRDLPKEKWVNFAKTADLYWCLSWRESFGASMAEVTASGGYPLLNWYLGADEVYPKEHLCKTPGELIQKTITWGNMSKDEKIATRNRMRKFISKYDSRRAVRNMREFIEKIYEESPGVTGRGRK